MQGTVKWLAATTPLAQHDTSEPKLNSASEAMTSCGWKLHFYLEGSPRTIDCVSIGVSGIFFLA